MEASNDYTKHGLLHDMFVRQAKKTPNNVAVVCQSGGSLTYGELDDYTDKLASYLRLKGVVPDSCVGIYMDKSLEYVISYISILKAGGAYLPLDVAYPSRLLHDILLDASPVFILSKTPLIPNLDTMQDNALNMTGDWLSVVTSELSAATHIPERGEMTLDNLAYTVYSSGTTGKPKGIQCPHRGAVFSYTWRHDTYPYGENEREACNIFIVWEFFRPLCKGATLYIIPDNVIYDPPQLTQFIKENKITRMLFTPSLFETVIEYNIPNVKECMKTVKQLWFCGEVVTTCLLDRSVKTFPWIQFVNLYSISESHDVAGTDLSEYHNAQSDVTARKYCPVGKVLAGGVKVYIMNEELSVQPVGISGEIYIGGPTLARGYLNRPDLNRTRFIDAPQALGLPAGSRLYRSGDWGYLLSDGSLEICGRCDSMHKVRGYSIEVQAIESAMLDLPMVASCVILVEGEEGEDKFLVSYVVTEGQTTKREIREALKRILPFYMIPSYFIFLQSIPVLAASGKLDKKALPAYDSQEVCNSNEFTVSTDSERLLLPIWRELLGSKHIDVQESFFDLGGHSLLAAKLLSRISNDMEVQLTVQDLFKHPSITAMAKLIDCKKSGQPMIDETVADVDLNKEVDKHDQATLINRPLAHVQSLAETSLDMQLRAFWRMFNYRPNWRTGSVLITGSTGFLGAFLIKELILNTQTHIHCIVRTSSQDDDAKNRVLANIAKYKLFDGKYLTEEIVSERISALNGDVSLLRMGLSQEDYGYLLTEIDFVMHAAAYVNLLYPYRALHAANVMGTENIIVFACTGKIKPIHYVSTDAVFPAEIDQAKENSDMTQYGGKLSDGYSQTKWVAEQLILKASQRGLPVAVYRCGNISGDSRSAAWNKQDFVLSIIQALTKLQCAPDIEWEIEFTPVDFVSQVIVLLTQNVSLAFGKIFHLIQPKKITIRTLTEWMNKNGYQVKLVPHNEWIERLKSQAGNQIPVLQRLVETSLLSQETLESRRRFKNSNLFYVLPEFDLQYPSISDSLLLCYFKGLREAKLIPEYTAMTSGVKSLDGMVAVVTGSSGGIGEAIARHLASAGAKVALGARRKERLEDLKKRLIDMGMTARYTVCDVTKADEVADLVRETEEEYGQPVDILVNNAGVMYYTDMVSKHQDEWERQIDINCKGVVNGVGAVIDSMTKRKKGHIINISSNAGRRGFAGLAVYSGTKFFIEGFSQALRQEMVEYNVRVSTIQPGDVSTELLSHTTDMQAKDKYDGSTQTPILAPDDIAKAVVYIASQPSNVAINEVLVEPAGAPI